MTVVVFASLDKIDAPDAAESDLAPAGSTGSMEHDTANGSPLAMARLYRLLGNAATQLSFEALRDEATASDTAADTAADTASSSPVETDRPCVILLDGRSITMEKTRLPARNERQAKAAAPYVIEDTLATGVDQIHIALGAEDSDQERRLTVGDRARLDALIAALQDAGLDPVSAYAESDLLKPGEQPHKLTYQSVLAHDAATLAGQDRILARRQDGTGFGLDAALEPLLATLLTREAGDRVEADTSIVTKPESQMLTGARLQRLRDTGDNLLVDGLAPKRKNATGWRKHGLTLALVASCLMAIGLAALIDIASMQARADQLDQDSDAVLADAFPKARNMAHMRQILAGLTASDGDTFLSLSAAVFDVVEGNDNVRLGRIRFNGDRATLDITLDAASFGDLQAIKTGLTGLGITAREGSSRQVNGRVESDLSLSR